MRFIAAAIALCFALAPLEAFTPDSHQASVIQVKAKAPKNKNKVKARKPPKRNRRTTNHA